MKYSLYEELLNDKDILSHVFLECAISFIKDIAAKNDGLTKEEIKKRKVDIELKIDGRKCSPRAFFELLYDQYSEQVEKKATEIVKEQTSGKVQELIDKLYEYQNVINSWEQDINWEVENPYKK